MKPETLALSTLFAVLAGCHAVDVSQPDPMAHAATRAPRTVDEPARSPRPQQDPTARAATRSPLTVDDLAKLKQVVLLGDDDIAALQMSLPVLEGQVEAILDVWYGFVGKTPQLLHYFTDTGTGKPDAAYLAAVRKRFGAWILATARGRYDQAWLDHQHEIALRHHSSRKNATDGAKTPPIVHFRYLPALVYPVTATLKPFLEKGGHSAADVERMHQAWIKAVLLQTILWSHPYVRSGEF